MSIMSDSSVEASSVSHIRVSITASNAGGYSETHIHLLPIDALQVQIL